MDDEYITLFFLLDKKTKRYIDVATTSKQLALNNGVSPSTVRASVHRTETGKVSNSKYVKAELLKSEILDLFEESYFIDEILNA